MDNLVVEEGIQAAEEHMQAVAVDMEAAEVQNHVADVEDTEVVEVGGMSVEHGEV